MDPNQKRRDYPGWEELREGCDSIEGLSIPERREAQNALRLLEDMFGSDFPAVAYADGHPMREYLLNRVPWTRRWLIHFAEVLEKLPLWENYQSLEERLRNRTGFGEGLSVLETAYKFSTGGFAVSVDPLVEIGRKPKKPDLKVQDASDGTELFVEVSVLYESQAVREAYRISQTILFSLLPCRPKMHYSARLLKSLAPRHLSEVQDTVQRFIQECKGENKFGELILPKVIELAIAPDDERVILEDWARPRGLEVDGLSGPPFDSNEIARTKTKIKGELCQLPPGFPNILVIENNSIFAHARDTAAILGDFEEEVYRYPHLLFMVLCGRGFGEGEDMVVQEDRHLLIQRSMFHSFVEQQMLVLNRFCESPVCQTAIQRLQGVFTGHCRVGIHPSSSRPSHDCADREFRPDDSAS